MLYQWLLFGNINWSQVALAFLTGTAGTAVSQMAALSMEPASAVFGNSALSIGQWLVTKGIGAAGGWGYTQGVNAMNGGIGRERQGGLLQVLYAVLGRTVQLMVALDWSSDDGPAVWTSM
jgi:hypothetical protein